MNINVIERNGKTVAVVYSDTKIISDEQSALDFAMTVRHETGTSRIVLNKEAVAEDFFILSTRLAGGILQKYINCQVKFAVYGDFTKYASKPLKDFFYESNHGEDFFFTATKESAVEKLLQVK